MTPQTVGHQAPLSMRFSRQEYWSGLLFPSPENLPDTGIKPLSPAWQVDSLPLSHQGNPIFWICWLNKTSVVHSLSRVQLFGTPWTVAHQASLSFIISWSFLKLMSIESMLSSQHLILCCPLLFPSTFPASQSFPMSWLFASGGQLLEKPQL